jgi:hypothetical protein
MSLLKYNKNELEKFVAPHNEIKKWAKSNLEVEDMIKYYIKFKNLWENEKFISINVEQIILKLSRFKKHEMLKYIFDNNSVYKLHFKKCNKSPLNEAVWISNSSENTYDISYKIINSVNILIENKFNYMGFTEFDKSLTNAASGDSKETFLDSLMHPDNKLDNVKKIHLYKYFTEKLYNDTEFKKSMNDMFNKCSNKNINIFKNKIIFLLTRNINEMTFIIFEKIINFIVNNSYSLMILNVILKEPSKSCFDEYFKVVDLVSIRNEMCNIILINHTEWIKNQTENQLYIEDIENKHKKKELYINLLQENYIKFYALMSVYYNNNINKDEIIDKLFTNCQRNLGNEVEVKIKLEFFKNINIYKKYSLNSLPKDLIESKILFNFIKDKYFLQECSKIVKFSIQSSIEKIFNIPINERKNTCTFINNFINNFENNIECCFQKKIYTLCNFPVKNSYLNVNKLEIKYKFIFVKYFKYVEQYDIKKDFTTIDIYFDNIKYSIEKNEKNLLHDTQKLIISEDHINKILIGLIFSFEEINLIKNNLKIMLLIGYLNENLHDNIFQKITDFLKTDEFEEIICEFDNPTLSKFLPIFTKALS